MTIEIIRVEGNLVEMIKGTFKNRERSYDRCRSRKKIIVKDLGEAEERLDLEDRSYSGSKSEERGCCYCRFS